MRQERITRLAIFFVLALTCVARADDSDPASRIDLGYRQFLQSTKFAFDAQLDLYRQIATRTKTFEALREKAAKLGPADLQKQSAAELLQQLYFERTAINELYDKLHRLEGEIEEKIGSPLGVVKWNRWQLRLFTYEMNQQKRRAQDTSLPESSRIQASRQALEMEKTWQSLPAKLQKLVAPTEDELGEAKPHAPEQPATGSTSSDGGPATH